MADPVSLSLPSLSSNNLVRYKGIPRRYEETRPVFIQGNAHRKILGLDKTLCIIYMKSENCVLRILCHIDI